MKPLEDQIAELIAGWREYAVGHTQGDGKGTTMAMSLDRVHKRLFDEKVQAYIDGDMQWCLACRDAGYALFGILMQSVYGLPSPEKQAWDAMTPEFRERFTRKWGRTK